jgi:hypothetical protein
LLVQGFDYVGLTEKSRSLHSPVNDAQNCAFFGIDGQANLPINAIIDQFGLSNVLGRPCEVVRSKGEERWQINLQEFSWRRRAGSS